MFFKKRSPKTTELEQNRRAHYRKPIAGPHRLEARLHVPGWDPLPVELLDLSAGGAGIRLNLAQERGLQVGDDVELSIGALMRDEVVVRARIATIKADGAQNVRYGLQFIDSAAIVGQADDLYRRHFNRRRHVRVRPSLDQRIPAVIRIAQEQIRTQVHDISESGLSVLVTPGTAAQLADIESVEITFQLPESTNEVELRLGVRHRTPLNEQVRVGFEFEVRDSDAASVEAVRSYVAARENELAKWDKSAQ